MNHDLEIRDRLSDCLPSSVGIVPNRRGRGSSDVPIGERFRVHTRPVLDTSFYERFEACLSDNDLPLLFWGAKPPGDLSLEQYRSHVALRACAIAARSVMVNRGGVPWTRVGREIVALLRGQPTDFCAAPPATNGLLLELRRRTQRYPAYSAAFVEQLESQRPLVVLGNQLVVTLPTNWNFSRPASAEDVVDVVALPQPWFEPIIETISTGLAATPASAENRDDAVFYAELAASKTPIRGTGTLADVEVSVPGPNRLRVSIDTGGPFIMDTGDDHRCVVWPACAVFIDAECQLMVCPVSSLVIGVRSLQSHSSVSRPDALPTNPAGLSQWTSNVGLHPFVSPKLTVCCGDTIDRYRSMGKYTSIADVFLQGHLRAAARVFRHGWKRTNVNKVFRDLRQRPFAAGLHDMSIEEARQYAAAHPETELVSWNR
jgi:hypothetical protein